MQTYSVKQIAEMLNTNPETVRRWIRDDKLKAVQISRKSGNVVTDVELQKFLKGSPKYLSKSTASITAAVAAATAPVTGIAAAIAGGVVTGILMGLLDERKSKDVRVLPDDLKAYLRENIKKCKDLISQKEVLIKQTEEEIASLQGQIEQYQYLIDHDEIIKNKIRETEKIMENEEEQVS